MNERPISASAHLKHACLGVSFDPMGPCRDSVSISGIDIRVSASRHAMAWVPVPKKIGFQARLIGVAGGGPPRLHPVSALALQITISKLSFT
jgi:hypothetical protein